MPTLPTPASCIKGLPTLHKPAVPARAILKDKADDLQDQLEAERAKRELAARKTEGLKERIAALEAMADDLARARQQHDAYAAAKAKAEADSRKLPSGLGMMTFQAGGFGEGNHVKPRREGRNSRRTAFTTDYCGRAILGESEWAHKAKLQSRANDEMDRRELSRSVARAATTEPTLAASSHQSLTPAGAVEGGSSAAISSPSPAAGAARSLSRTAANTKPKVSMNHRLEPAGCGGVPAPGHAASKLRSNGLPTLDAAKQCSSRRTRFYINYEGKRVMMDPCDWPNEHGFVLTGK